MWSAIERFSLQGVQFIIQIILARLLLPSDYGMIGMLAIFLQVAQVFIDSGFTNALIQKKIELKRILPLSFILIFLSQYYSMVYCFFGFFDCRLL